MSASQTPATTASASLPLAETGVADAVPAVANGSSDEAFVKFKKQDWEEYCDESEGRHFLLGIVYQKLKDTLTEKQLEKLKASINECTENAGWTVLEAANREWEDQVKEAVPAVKRRAATKRANSAKAAKETANAKPNTMPEVSASSSATKEEGSSKGSGGAAKAAKPSAKRSAESAGILKPSNGTPPRAVKKMVAFSPSHATGRASSKAT